MATKPIKFIDKAVIVLTHLYRENNTLFSTLFNQLTLDESTRETLLEHIKHPPIYDQQTIKSALYEFYNIFNNDEVVPLVH